MNNWLMILGGITGVMLTLAVLSVIREIIYALRESNSIKIYDSHSDRIQQMIDIYINASNIYITYLQKRVSLADYAYLAEVAIYGLVKELGGDTTTLLQKIQQALGKDKDQQGTDGIDAVNRIPPKLGPISPSISKDIPKKKPLDKTVDEILDEWESKHPDWRNKKDKKDDKDKGKKKE